MTSRISAGTAAATDGVAREWVPIRFGFKRFSSAPCCCTPGALMPGEAGRHPAGGAPLPVLALSLLTGVYQSDITLIDTRSDRVSKGTGGSPMEAPARPSPIAWSESP